MAVIFALSTIAFLLNMVLNLIGFTFPPGTPRPA